MSATAVIELAKSQVGYREGYRNGSWDNDQKYSLQIPGMAWSNFQPWCATFCSWLFYKTGQSAIAPRTASVAAARDWYRAHGRFSAYPAIGAQVIFGTHGDAHTGMVYTFDSTWVYTIEGNTNNDGSAEGNGVYMKKRARHDAWVYGYGYPHYAQGIKSADPKWGGTHPVVTPPPHTTPPRPPAQPTVRLSLLREAAILDPRRAQGLTTPGAAGSVTIVKHALAAERLLSGPYAEGGYFGSTTVKAYAAWQRRLGYSRADADGIPGATSLGRLAAKHGFRVVP